MKLTLLTEVVFIGPSGLEIDYSVPRRKGYVSTDLTPGKGGSHLIKRHRKIPGTSDTLTMYFTAYRDKSDADVVRAIKKVNTPAIAQLVRRVAIQAVAGFKAAGESFDCVVPAPSSSPLAQTLASHIATRLGVPVVSAVYKDTAVGKIGVSQRMGTAWLNFNVADHAPNLKGSVLVVDDASTSGSTLVGIAANLLLVANVSRVTGFAWALSN